jgi:hypothetical protein
MACDIATGRVEACKESVGGLRNLFIANFDSTLYSTATLTADEITALVAPVDVYKFELRGDNNTFEETNENSRDNGTSFWTQTGAFSLKKQDLATQSALTLLSYGRPHIIVEDYNGNFRMAGFENGCEVTVNTSTGGAMGDLSGYNITFEGKERTPSSFIDSTLMDDVAGFVISATVIDP